MRFRKLHGAGNDYVLVAEEELPADADLSDLARRMSDRRTGIGGDGLIVVRSSADADARMEMYNADGTRSAMCGNGVRLVARFTAERKGTSATALAIETDVGVLRVELRRESGEITGARAEMGRPVSDPARVPLAPGAGEPGPGGFARLAFELDGARLAGTALSIGNPHVVIEVEDVDRVPIERWGPAVENDPRLPQRANAEFVKVSSREEVRERTWERGAGETRSCGSGACATVVALAAAGRTERTVRVVQRGGTLTVEWLPSGEIFLSGPVAAAFDGTWSAIPRRRS